MERAPENFVGHAPLMPTAHFFVSAEHGAERGAGEMLATAVMVAILKSPLRASKQTGPVAAGNRVHAVVLVDMEVESLIEDAKYDRSPKMS